MPLWSNCDATTKSQHDLTGDLRYITLSFTSSMKLNNDKIFLFWKKKTIELSYLSCRTSTALPLSTPDIPLIFGDRTTLQVTIQHGLVDKLG